MLPSIFPILATAQRSVPATMWKEGWKGEVLSILPRFQPLIPFSCVLMGFSAIELSMVYIDQFLLLDISRGDAPATPLHAEM